MSFARRARAALVLLSLLTPACFNFRVPGPEDPTPVSQPRLVTVTIEYRQPNGCVNVASSCSGPPRFFGTWMRAGGEFALTGDPGSHVWVGTAYAVPVNYPPRDEPYEVRIYDPYLADDPTGGFTARRLTIGRESVSTLRDVGSRNEHGLIYVDDNGFGRNPL